MRNIINMRNTFILFVIFLGFTQIENAQVGINTNTPKATLEIKAGNQATPNNTDGVLIPRVDAFPATNPTVDQQGMLIFLTTTSGVNAPGFYYWDFPTLTWVGISSSASGDKDWLVQSTNQTPSDLTQNIYHTGSIAIGTDNSSEKVSIKNEDWSTSIYNHTGNLTTNGENKIGINNAIEGTSDDNSYGIINQIQVNGTGENIGLKNIIGGASGNSSGRLFGVQNTYEGTADAHSLNGIHTQFITPDGFIGEKVGSFTQLDGYDSQQIGTSSILTSRKGNSFQIGGNNQVYYNGDPSDRPYLYGEHITVESNSEGGSNFGIDILMNQNSTVGQFVGINSLINVNDYAVGFQNTINLTENSARAIDNSITGNSTSGTTISGTSNYISASSTGLAAGTINVVGNSTLSNISVYNSNNGNLSGPITGVNNTFNNGIDFGSNITGYYNEFLFPYETGTIIGLNNNITKSGDGGVIGVKNKFSGDSNESQIGVYNEIDGTNTGGSRDGFLNNFATSVPTRGLVNNLNPNGSADQSGVETNIAGIATGGNLYGEKITILNTGPGNKYGVYSKINTTAGGTHYGIYSEALKTGTTNFAGYFLGNVSIGTTTSNNYLLPASKGNTGETLELVGNQLTFTRGLSNLSVMRANLTANQSLNTSGWQKIPFNTVPAGYDTNSEFNTTTNRFVATKNGFYEVNAGFHTDSQANTQFYSIGVYVNGILYQQSSANHYTNGLVSRATNCVIKLNAGDYVEIFAENYQSGVAIDGFSGKTYFEVKQIR